MKITYFNTEDRAARVELTRRNLETLLAKLDDPDSVRTLTSRDGPGKISVVAVENDRHYRDRAPGPVLINGEVV